MAKHLYVISDAHHRYVKIGRSDNVEARLAQLQSATPYPLHVEAEFRGLGWMEQTCHRAFRLLLENNEWFERVGPIDHFLRFVREYRGAGLAAGDALLLMALAAGLCEFDGSSAKQAPDAAALLRTVGESYLAQADAIEAQSAQAVDA